MAPQATGLLKHFGLMKTIQISLLKGYFTDKCTGPFNKTANVLAILQTNQWLFNLFI